MKLKRINTITEFHRFRGVPSPEHPLISLIDYSKVKFPEEGPVSIVLDFYTIALKRDIGGKLYYGQQVYDFDQGLMSFIGLDQVLRLEIDPAINADRSGYLLQIHPDFLWNSPLAKTIKQYAFLTMQ